MLFLSFVFTAYAAPLDKLPDSVRQNQEVSTILAKNPIKLKSKRQAELAFDTASTLIDQPDFLGALQDAYRAMLPEGTPPEFIVEQTAPGVYQYANQDGEETYIEELQRTRSPEIVSLYLLTEGDRFFGHFKALTCVAVTPTKPGHIEYHIRVFAWPYNPLSRFIARTGIVNLYFKRKTSQITDLAVAIGKYMTQQSLALGSAPHHSGN